MLSFRKRHRLAFTLVEMAIVLGIAGTLFTGLWRLISNGNSQMRDQTTANLHEQMVSAINGYLQSTDGSNWATHNNAGSAVQLLLPSTAAHAAGTSNCTSDTNMTTGAVGHTGLCTFLPAGTYASSTNPYGQTYNIFFLGDGSGAAPQYYSFLIVTSGGETISDTSGGRITAMIGGDGGFLYSSNVCTSGTNYTNTACGAYGAWNVALGSYGTSPPTALTNLEASGHVVSRTYYAAAQFANFNWLSRSAMAGDTTYSFNTMGTDLYMGQTSPPSPVPTNIHLAPYNTATGGGSIFADQGNIYMGSAAGSTGVPATSSINMQGASFNAGGGTVNMAAGPINMQAGSISMGGGSITLGGGGISGTGASNISLTGLSLTSGYALNVSGSNSGGALANFSGSYCVMSTPGLTAGNAACPYTVQVDTLTSTNLVNTVSLYAQTFIYSGSDRRLKKNIRDLVDPLSDVMKLKPVSFTFKANNQDSMGVIAQDLETIYPQLVTHNDQGMKSVNYEGLIAPLIGAVQELKKENEELRQQIKAQAAQQEKIEKQLSKANPVQ